MRKPLGALAFLALLALLLGGCATVRDGFTSQMPPRDSVSAQRLAPGPHDVGRVELELVDESRPTPANGDFAGAPQRKLVSEVWYPEQAAGKRPLAVYSHGFMSSRKECRYLAEHLASHGWVVVAVDFPLSNGSAPGGPALTDIANQPGDLSFIIDSLLASEGEEPPFYGEIDPERIAAVGLSLGGLTSTLVAFHPTLRDPRVKAAISLAGPSAFFSERFFASAPVPFLMVAGTADTIVPYDANGPPLLERAPTASLVTIEGGSHVGFADIASRVFRFSRNPDRVGCRVLRKKIPDQAEAKAEKPFEDLGGPEVGILPPEDSPMPCSADRLPTAIRPQRQQLVTKLAVRAFLEVELAPEAGERAAASRYLEREMPLELGEVRFSSPSTRLAAEISAALSGPDVCPRSRKILRIVD